MRFDGPPVAARFADPRWPAVRFSPRPLPPGAPRTVQAASPTNVRQLAGQRSATHHGDPEVQDHETGCSQRPATGLQDPGAIREVSHPQARLRRGVLLLPGELEAMQTFPSRGRQSFDRHALRLPDADGPRCAGTTPTNRSGPQYPRTGTAGQGSSLPLEASHPSALSDDDRNGKPGVNRGRKATGLGASTQSS
jgi:hypothetical protein